MILGTTLLRKIGKRWEKEDELSPGGVPPKGTEATVRAHNEPTVKDQEGHDMNLLLGTTLLTLAQRAPGWLHRAASDRVPW